MEPHTIIPVFGEDIEIVVPSSASGYAMCVGIQTSPPGGGPPPHRHLREEEIFVVLEGDYEFFDGSRWIPLPPHQPHCSVRGTFHAFRNVGHTTGRLMFATNGGGLDEYFQHISDLVLPRDLERLQQISQFYNYEFAPLEAK